MSFMCLLLCCRDGGLILTCFIVHTWVTTARWQPAGQRCDGERGRGLGPGRTFCFQLSQQGWNKIWGASCWRFNTKTLPRLIILVTGRILRPWKDNSNYFIFITVTLKTEMWSDYKGTSVMTSLMHVLMDSSGQPEPVICWIYSQINICYNCLCQPDNWLRNSSRVGGLGMDLNHSVG